MLAALLLAPYDMHSGRGVFRAREVIFGEGNVIAHRQDKAGRGRGRVERQEKRMERERERSICQPVHSTNSHRSRGTIEACIHTMYSPE